MHPRAAVAPRTIAFGVLLSVAIDAGRTGSQAAANGPPPAGRRWQPMPLFPPGASVVLLLGDPLREPGYMYVRFPAGYEPPLHSHKATGRIFVNRGTLLLRMPNRDEIRKPEGEYFVVKSGIVHETACIGPEDCFCHISVDRAFDVIPFLK
jgi:quercetin dioxygenase-like cupin family protein